MFAPSKFSGFISLRKVLGMSLVFIMTKGMKLYPRSHLAIDCEQSLFCSKFVGKNTVKNEKQQERTSVTASVTASLPCKRHMLRRSHAHAHTCFPFFTTALRAKLRDFSESTCASKPLDTVYDLT